MTWLLREIVDLFNALAAWFYRRKYGEAARRLGRLPHEQDGRRGFIILEIDGLAHDYLRRAVRQGAMPYLGRLLYRRKLRLARWHCGLPSTTPASQAGIMYGNNWDIPGFRWYDKATGDMVLCKFPGVVRAIQDRISAGRAGLLRGGSSYTNLFDGDARLALFTLAALGRDRLFEDVRGLGFLVLFLLSPIRMLRVILLSVWTWLLYVAVRVAALVAPSAREFTFWGPINQILNVIFREVTTFSVMVDVYRGMPAIYASYVNYDEIAHHFGADSKEAFHALRGLDGQIAQIDRIRQVYGRRQYDLYVVSDHGLTPSVPFRRAYGQTVEQFIGTHTGQAVSGGHERQRTEEYTVARIHSLLDEMAGFEQRSHWPLTAQLLRVARRRLSDRLQRRTLLEEWDLSKRQEIVVRSSGSLSHVYFAVAQRAMDLSEVTMLYPGLLEALVAQEGIGLVAGREGADVVMAGRSGTLWVGPDGVRLSGENPLLQYADVEWTLEEIQRLARFPHAGDLVLLGAWDGSTVVSFEDQVATHGGLGGPQVWPFIAYSSSERLPAQGIGNAEEVYTQLVSVYGDYG